MTRALFDLLFFAMNTNIELQVSSRELRVNWSVHSEPATIHATCYPSRVANKPRMAIVGAGSLAQTLARALHESGYRIAQIICRDTSSSRQRARKLARNVGAQVVSLSKETITAELLWFCVPDREIRFAASSLAKRSGRDAARGVSPKGKGSVRVAFHSSGALPSSELASLKTAGIAIASVHPLMTFVPGSRPSLEGVPFALEGDPAAVRVARRIVRDLGGESFSLPASRKAAYHAWATMTSPLLLAFLVTLEDAARVAGLKPADARRMSLPIMRQTLENYSRLAPAHSFSGPIIRGDVQTVARHLAVMAKAPAARKVYISLARSAMGKLPTKNREQLNRLLE